MRKTITIDPVTRIEGHARVFIQVDDAGQLESAGLVVNELRGFERILIGMEADRMPLVTARICGVCPAAHHLAATNALDNAARVEPPPAARLLRELLYMGHLVHSHSLSLFVLQGPDLILGPDADPAARNVVGIVQANPELAKMALRCRSLGQKIGEMISGRGTHPITSVAGGITFRLDAEKARLLASWADEIQVLVRQLVPVAKDFLLRRLEQYPLFLSDWVVPAWSLGTVQGDTLSLLEGQLRAVDAQGETQAQFATPEYDQYLTESALEYSYMKPVGFRHDGQVHDYRVGPLARLTVASSYGTPLADQELASFRALAGNPSHALVLQTYARVIELLYAAERAGQILQDPGLHGESRAPANYLGNRGVGHVEAPRGTLIHDYEIDEAGRISAANLIVATQQNYALINQMISLAAAGCVVDKSDDEVLLNGVEFAIRCFDPCLSCATHALGAMPLEVHLRHGASTLRVVRRSAV